MWIWCALFHTFVERTVIGHWMDFLLSIELNFSLKLIQHLSSDKSLYNQFFFSLEPFLICTSNRSESFRFSLWMSQVNVLHFQMNRVIFLLESNCRSRCINDVAKKESILQFWITLKNVSKQAHFALEITFWPAHAAFLAYVIVWRCYVIAIETVELVYLHFYCIDWTTI